MIETETSPEKQTGSREARQLIGSLHEQVASTAIDAVRADTQRNKFDRRHKRRIEDGIEFIPENGGFLLEYTSPDDFVQLLFDQHQLNGNYVYSAELTGRIHIVEDTAGDAYYIDLIRPLELSDGQVIAPGGMLQICGVLEREEGEEFISSAGKVARDEHLGLYHDGELIDAGKVAGMTINCKEAFRPKRQKNTE